MVLRVASMLEQLDAEAPFSVLYRKLAGRLSGFAQEQRDFFFRRFMNRPRRKGGFNYYHHSVCMHFRMVLLDIRSNAL